VYCSDIEKIIGDIHVCISSSHHYASCPHWDGTRLWNFEFHIDAGQDPIKVSAVEVLENTTNPKENKWSCAGALAPFQGSMIVLLNGS